MAAAVALAASPAEAAGCRMEEMADGAAVLEARAASSEGSAWVVRRRSGRTQRGKTWVDGVILLPEGSPLKVKVKRRRDGDHRLVLGPEGEAPPPAGELAPLLAEIRREHLDGYRILSERGEEAALLYAPHSAERLCVERKEGIRIDLLRPEDKKGVSIGRDEIRGPF